MKKLITADGRTQTIRQWHNETGVSMSKIDSRYKRTRRGDATLTPEQWVGLEKMPQPKNQYHGDRKPAGVNEGSWLEVWRRGYRQHWIYRGFTCQS